jgi:hypothetical protein
MRVALLQTRLDGRSRSANIQGLIAAITTAADATPAPDLLVLPGLCDTGGEAAGPGLTEAKVQTIGETIALKAREWGVYIAAGLHIRHQDEWVPAAVLFDPDADRVAVGAGRAGAEGSDGGPLALRYSALGAIGVFEWGGDKRAEDAALPERKGAFVAVPVTPGPSGGRKPGQGSWFGALCEDPAFRGDAYWGVVSPAGGAGGATDTGGPTTFLCDPDGKLIASTSDTDETILFAEVPLRRTEPPTELGAAAREGQAG